MLIYKPIDTRIETICGRQIFDSRGNPTVEACVILRSGAIGCAAVPSGASTGIFEAHELRDGDKAYGGKGVSKAVAFINGELRDALRGMDSANQNAVDTAMRALDGTENKSRLGANAILAVSLACARAAANCYSLPLYRWLGGINGMTMPVPMLNILNGGAHAGNNIDIQEFMIVPSGAGNFAQTMRMATEVYSALGKLLRQRGLATTVGDEGGYAPNLDADEQALELICEAITTAGYGCGSDVFIALDAAAGEWQQDDDYLLPKQGKRLTRDQLIDYFADLTERYPIISLEDPLGQDDFEGFAKLSARLSNVQTVGDDLFVTNPARVRKGIKSGSARAVLVKLNQIGTLSETMETVRLAQANNMRTIISHRSGETGDTFIADLAVALNAGQIKTGAPARSDRVEKYNRLLAIESELLGGI